MDEKKDLTMTKEEYEKMLSEMKKIENVLLTIKDDIETLAIAIS